jgi:ribose transport system permease protein
MKTSQDNGLRAAVKRVFGGRLTGIVITLLAILLVSALASGNFLTGYNIVIILRSLSFVGLVALGQTMVLLLGELDLSVGSVAGLTAVLSGVMMVNLRLPPAVAIAVGLAAGALCGLVNGLLVTKLKLNALVVTLGTMGIFSGLNLVISRGRAVMDIPESIQLIGQGDVLGIPITFLVMIAAAAMISVVLNRSAFGRYVFAIGNNREAAGLIGVRVDRIRILCFIGASVLSSMAGILMLCRLGSAQPQVGAVWQLPSIAAPVIGGTSLTGGIGSAGGAIIGAAIIGVIENIIVLFGVSPYWQSVVSGLVVVIAIAIDSIKRMVSKSE